MKTAKKYLEDLQSKGGELADVIEDNTDELIMLLKNYAKQVAEQTLKDAANELEIWNFKDEDIYYSAKEYVLKTPIQLP